MTLAFRHREIPESPVARWDARWKLAAVLLTVCGIAALDHLAPAAVALAKKAFLDTLAVSLSGSQLDSVRIVTALARELG